MTITEAMRDPNLFGRWFSSTSWNAWRAFLAALFGQPLDTAALDIYRRHTGRTTAPTAPAREGWVIVGRRGGKSRIAALIAVYLACFRSYDAVLAPGEVGTLAIVAADRKQARTILRYINGFLDGVPMLRRMVASRTAEGVTLTNRVVVEVHTASWRSLRGYTLIGAICDELAFWRTDDSANPDVEIINGLKPGMATVPGALLLCISSPYARRGCLWEAYRRHFGPDGDPNICVWQGDTASQNSTVDPQVIADAYEADEAAAAAEYGAEFRRDIESFVSREAVEAARIPDRRELPPALGVRYHAFVDPSGGSQDSMTLAIAHGTRDRVVLDCVREWRPPFSPAAVVAECAEVLRGYCTSVTGDRYGGEWPRERFREHRIRYEPAERTKSDIYGELLPLLNSGRVELLDDPRLLAQLLALERRTARGGRDSIDHPPRGHDDVINSASGALVQAAAHLRRAAPMSRIGANMFDPPGHFDGGAPAPARPTTVRHQNLPALMGRWR